MAKRQSLGKGLGALMPNVPRETRSAAEPAKKKAAVSATPAKATAPAKGVAGRSAPPRRPVVDSSPLEVAGLTLVEAPVRSIAPNPSQPRTVFDEEALAELVFSIREIGLLQPLVVRRKGDGYELIAGERRLRAAKKAGLKTVPVLVRDTADEALLRDALLENLHRSQLTALEEAAAYQQLLQDFGCTQDELATRLGRSRPQITNTLRLLNLPPAVQRRVAAGVLSAGHARALLALGDPADIERMAARIVAEGLSVRSVEEIISVGGAGERKTQAGKKAKPSGSLSAPGLTEIADRLSDRLDTRVKVQIGRARGKVVIEFATLSDLQRIVDIVAPRNSGVSSQNQ